MFAYPVSAAKILNYSNNHVISASCSILSNSAYSILSFFCFQKFILENPIKFCERSGGHCDRNYRWWHRRPYSHVAGWTSRC
jgi:hypothetical protein